MVETRVSGAEAPPLVAALLARHGYLPLATIDSLPTEVVGSYVLLFRVAGATEVEVGRLGRLRLGPGLYAYSGSALRGLRARVARHLRIRKQMHWHIDYVLTVATEVAVWVATGDLRRECLLAGDLLALAGVTVPARGLGASDCRCVAHLLRLPERSAAPDDLGR